MESESDWDETTAEAITPRVATGDSTRVTKGDTAPKIEFDSDDEFTSTTKQKKSSSNTTNNINGAPSKNHSEKLLNGSRTRFNDEPLGGSRGSSSRSSPSTVKSVPRSMNAVTFNDTRGQRYSDEERPTPRPRVSSPTHSPGHPPPYDFSSAITEARNTPQPVYTDPPGKHRKGTTYDPGLGSWDDSEAEEQTLAQLRDNMHRANQIKNTEKKEEKSSSNWRDKFKSKQKTPKKSNSASQDDAAAVSFSSTATSPPAAPHVATVTDVQPHYESPWPESPRHQLHHQLQRHQNESYVYYFAEEKKEYLYAIEDHSNIKMEKISQKLIPHVKRGFRECFAVFHLIVSVIIVFIVEFIKFILRSIVYPLIYGILNSLADYLLKPILTVCFNGCLQPCLMVCYNVMVAMGTVCIPIIEVFKKCSQVCVIMLNAWRLCPISITNNHSRYNTETQHI
ncbi:uncharacterized protein LOC141912753 [Tubulanus polymorphus]|uniref:uncharacterized protein LOC141912753 n=1 Tax=Tubulanus polymorphus TaxID=672921 RepID=UPI003DA6A1FE